MPEMYPASAETDLITLRLDSTSQEHFDLMRRQYFPAEQNRVAAHLTLFHTLPRSEDVAATLDAVVANRSVFPLFVTGLRLLGRGVAYKVESADLLQLHRSLSVEFSMYLSGQDRQKFQPHVVIQNKVSSARAKSLLAILETQFRGFDVLAEGLDLWHYKGGPWEHAQTFLFKR